MLDRMFLGLDTPSASLPLSLFANLAFPDIAPEHGGTVPGPSSSPSIINDSSIIATIADLMGVWEAVVSEISESSIHAVESWKPGSTRAKITSRLLELEIGMFIACLATEQMLIHTGTRHHSYTSIGSLARVRTEPHLEPYFRAWLFYQFLHSAIHCCLYEDSTSLTRHVINCFTQKPPIPHLHQDAPPATTSALHVPARMLPILESLCRLDLPLRRRNGRCRTTIA